MEKILRRVILEGKFYKYTCERWTAFGWRLGQVCYETRTYRDGGCRSALMCRQGVLAEFNGREGENEKDLLELPIVPGLSETLERG